MGVINLLTCPVMKSQTPIQLLVTTTAMPADVEILDIDITKDKMIYLREGFTKKKLLFFWILSKLPSWRLYEVRQLPTS